jgi:hypothetical protein
MEGGIEGGGQFEPLRHKDTRTHKVNLRLTLCPLVPWCLCGSKNNHGGTQCTEVHRGHSVYLCFFFVPPW